MLMQEFASRFSAKNERSFLFEILRRVSRLDAPAMMEGNEPMIWSEWSSTSGTALPGLGVGRA